MHFTKKETAPAAAFVRRAAALRDKVHNLVSRKIGKGSGAQRAPQLLATARRSAGDPVAPQRPSRPPPELHAFHQKRIGAGKSTSSEPGRPRVFSTRKRKPANP